MDDSIVLLHCYYDLLLKLRLVNNGDTPTTLDQAEASKQIKMEDDAIYGREAEELRVEEKLGGDERQNEKEYKVEALGLQLRVTDTLFNIGPIANIQVCMYVYIHVFGIYGRV